MDVSQGQSRQLLWFGMIQAAVSGYVDEVMKWMKLAPWTDEELNHLFLIAVKANQGEVVDQLLAQGVDVAYKDQARGNTALHYAAMFGFADIVNQLLAVVSKDATNSLEDAINSPNRQGWTPFHFLLLAQEQKHSSLPSNSEAIELYAQKMQKLKTDSIRRTAKREALLAVLIKIQSNYREGLTRIQDVLYQVLEEAYSLYLCLNVQEVHRNALRLQLQWLIKLGCQVDCKALSLGIFSGTAIVDLLLGHVENPTRAVLELDEEGYSCLELLVKDFPSVMESVQMSPILLEWYITTIDQLLQYQPVWKQEYCKELISQIWEYIPSTASQKVCLDMLCNITPVDGISPTCVEEEQDVTSESIVSPQEFSIEEEDQKDWERVIANIGSTSQCDITILFGPKSCVYDNGVQRTMELTDPCLQISTDNTEEKGVSVQYRPFQH